MRRANPHGPLLGPLTNPAPGDSIRGGFRSVDTPTLRSRIWNLLRTARGMGRAGVAVATLATVLNATPEGVMGAVMGDMLEAPAGCDTPPIYCAPGSEGPTLTPRTFPEGT